jgi:coenzyme F420-reducing hydrogenase alpha subunit
VAAARVARELRACLEEMCELTQFLAEHITFPALERDYEFVALCPEDEYPMNFGPIRSNKGLQVDQGEFGRAIEERQVAHSTSLHAVVRDRGPYLVGPLARLNLNAEKLRPRAAELLPPVCRALGRTLPWRNNYFSLLARSLETVHALELAADLLGSYVPPPRSRVPIVPRAGIGSHGTEAPRGLCWHSYRTDADGSIVSARIIPPTSQNYATIEADLRALAPLIAELPDEDATLRCEHVIRNYDPCISCSVHFLKLSRVLAER